MTYNEQLDGDIKRVISSELEKVEASKDIYARIQNNIKGKRSRAYSISGIQIKNIALALSLSFAMLLTLALIFSPTVRAISADTINAIKVVFVVEGTADHYEIVEKDASKTNFTASVSKPTDLDGGQLKDKLGYGVLFPPIISENYTLTDKYLSLMFQKPIDYVTSGSLSASMLKAIDDAKEFEALKAHEPALNTWACYKRIDGMNIFISAYESEVFERVSGLFPESPLSKTREVRIGELKGVWVERSQPSYPNKTTDQITRADMTQKPSKLKKAYALEWDSKSIHYTLSYDTSQNFKPSLKESLKVAKEFMEKQ